MRSLRSRHRALSKRKKKWVSSVLIISTRLFLPLSIINLSNSTRYQFFSSLFYLNFSVSVKKWRGINGSLEAFHSYRKMMICIKMPKRIFEGSLEIYAHDDRWKKYEHNYKSWSIHVGRIRSFTARRVDWLSERTGSLLIFGEKTVRGLCVKMFVRTFDRLTLHSLSPIKCRKVFWINQRFSWNLLEFFRKEF